jgi:hypothetical protein
MLVVDLEELSTRPSSTLHPIFSLCFALIVLFSQQVSYTIGNGNVRILRFFFVAKKCLYTRNVPNHTELESALYSKLIKLVYIKPGLTVHQ